MYRGCKTVVRSAAGESNSFEVEVGLHRGSAISPYLFLLLMDVLTEDVRKDVGGLPGSMMFADDSVLCGDDETDMSDRVLGDLEESIRGQRHDDQPTKNTIHRL